MSRLEYLTAELSSLSERDLERVEELIRQLKNELPPKRVKNDAYLQVREALKGIEGSMSQFIIDERADRV